MVQEDLAFERFLIWSSRCPPVWWSKTIYAILKKGIIGNIHVNLYEIWTVVQEEISFKDISYIELLQPICLVDWNHLCNFGRMHHEEQSVKLF